MGKWDSRFLGLAAHVATWSLDPSTKTGAVVVDAAHRVVSLGFNGFPHGIADDERLLDRETKYEIILHCEINAILFANQSLIGCTLYAYPFLPCSRCASVIIQERIARVVAPKLNSQQEERWGKSLALSRELFAEAGVEVAEMVPFDAQLTR